MLAKGAPFHPSPITSRVHGVRPYSNNHNYIHRCVVFDFVKRGSSSSSNSDGKRVLGLVRAGDGRKHLDGLSFDDNTPGIESLVEEELTVTNTASPTMSPTVGLAGSFGKLKSQKLKLVAQKASLMKHNVRKPVQDDALSNKTIILDSCLESAENQKSLDAFKHGHKVSRPTQTQDSGQDVKSSNVQLEHGGSTSYFRGWGNGGSMYNHNSKLAYPLQRRPKSSSENDFFSRKSFRDMGCSEFMIESLKGQLFLHPSHIQAMAFASVIMGKSCVIADQSGSGKTLAYLIPIVQRLRQEELQGLHESSSQSPRVIVVVPTAELASQVLNNCRSMSKFGVPFRSMVVTGGFRQRTQLENLEQGLDVLIVTPGRFMFLIKEGFLKLTNLRCAVLDEVDILFNDKDFEVALQSLINSSPVTTQYLFVTATLPVDVYNKLVEVFPDCEVIMGPGMHRTSTGLEEVLVDCSGENGTEKTPDTAFLNKKFALLQLVEQSPVSKTIVFCNKIETCRKVENVLKRFDRKGSRVRVLPFHAALAQESRLANMKEFLNSLSEECSLFLVCTDRASRGIDFAGVDHVVLFDFPRDPSEYVRRVGRTARGAGGKGKAFIFVVGKQVSLARRIIERNQKGHPLHDVPSAYEVISH